MPTSLVSLLPSAPSMLPEPNKIDRFTILMETDGETSLSLSNYKRGYRYSFLNNKNMFLFASNINPTK